MRKKKTGFVVIPEHDAKPWRGRTTTLPRVPQYKIDKNIESLLSHFTVYFDSELQTHVVPIRPRWAKWFGYHRKKTKKFKVADIVLRANGKPRGRRKLAFINGDCCDYRLCNLAAKTAQQVEKEILNKEGKQRCSTCKAIKTVDQFNARGYECKACLKERQQLRVAKESKQTVCQTCGSVFDGEGRTRRYCSEACRIEKAKQRRQQAVESRKCENCNAAFTVHSKQKNQKYCSAECRQKAGRHNHTCEQCGKSFASPTKQQRFCSQACKKENSRTYKECEGCGKTFHRRRGGGPGKDDLRFCNKKCCGEWRKRQTAASRQAAVAELLLPYSLSVYNVSQKLDARVRRYLRKQLKSLKVRLKQKQRVDWLRNAACEECGKPKQRGLFGGGEEKHLCKGCAKKSYFWEFECERCGCDAVTFGRVKKTNFCQRCQRRRHKKRSTHLKRCEKRGLPYDPAVKTSEVGERANWRCEICQKEVMRVWKTHGPNQKPYDLGPTIDHIVPLLLPENTKHGHTWENTQLACWKCNTDKNDDCELWLTECDDPRQAIGLTNTTIFQSISPDS